MKILKQAFKTILIASLFVVCNLAYAKTVFVANHQNDGVAAYEINGEEIEYQKTIDLPTNGWGPADITIDPASGILFVSNEASGNIGGNVIELIQARTFLRAGTITLSHTNAPTNVTGLAVDNNDPNSPEIYLTDRNTKKLYTYLWDSEDLTMTLKVPDPNDPNDPDYFLNPIELDNINYACGLALDEDEGLLYVSDFYYSSGFSKYVYVYDRDNAWEHVQTIDMGENVVGIALDDPNEYLYGGSYGGHNYLVKHDLSTEQQDPNDLNSETYIDAYAIGMDVDQDSELVYVSTISYDTGGQIEVWNTEHPLGMPSYLTDSETQGLSGPAGVCVSDVGFVPPFGISKIDDVNEVIGCVVSRPGEEITYTICYEYDWDETGDPNIEDFTEIVITDYLPGEVDFISADPNAGYYDASSHTYIWEIDGDSIGSSNCIDLTVEINNKVTPGGQIENSVLEIISDINGQEYTDGVEIETLICPCDDCGEIIYVDKDATSGSETGVSWANAYLTIEEALGDAFPCDEIWVAEGTYKPVEEPNMVNYVGVYGGFAGDETKRYERDWSVYEAIICADPNDDDDLTLGFDDPNRNTYDNFDYAVVANDYIKWAVLDGFTIRRGWAGGVYCDGSSVLIEHNKIIDNGIGIFCEDTGTPLLRNNWIYENETGIYMYNAVSAAVIQNNTIAYNDLTGIYVESGVEPLISNCILWGHADANDIVGGNATYSCIEYPNHLYEENETDPNNPIYLGIGEGNITGEANDPLFVDADNDDYHLDPNSPCIDAGDPNFIYTGNERDIDKHFRVLYGRVDMGADEYCDECDTSDADFTENDIVNMLDFAEFSAAWLIDSTDPDWSSHYSEYDLCGDGDAVDVNDLLVFAEDWLWRGCDAMKDVPVQESMAMGMYDEMSTMAGGAESMMMPMSMSMESSTLVAVEQAPPTLEDLAAQLLKTLDWLDEIWLYPSVQETIDEADWLDFVESVEELLLDLQQQ